jgi:hypothetical protein
MRGAFCSGQVTPAIAACTASGGASRTAGHPSNSARSRRKAAPESRFSVRCDSNERTSSDSGSIVPK